MTRSAKPTQHERPSPAMRRLAGAIATARDVDGVLLFGPDAAADVAAAVRELVREELAVILGSAVIGLTERAGRSARRGERADAIDDADLPADRLDLAVQPVEERHVDLAVVPHQAGRKDPAVLELGQRGRPAPLGRRTAAGRA